MHVVSMLVWGVAIGLLAVFDAGLPLWLGVTQATALASYAVAATGGPSPKPLVDVEQRLEIYAATMTRVIDTTLIDGTISGVGSILRGWSTVLRHRQPGTARVYALAMLSGTVAMLGYFLWR